MLRMILPGGLVVLSREGCGLCEEMLHELAELERRADPSARHRAWTWTPTRNSPARYGLKVPVLLLDGSVICHYTLNSNELLRLLRRSAAILPR